MGKLIRRPGARKAAGKRLAIRLSLLVRDQQLLHFGIGRQLLMRTPAVNPIQYHQPCQSLLRRRLRAPRNTVFGSKLNAFCIGVHHVNSCRIRGSGTYYLFNVRADSAVLVAAYRYRCSYSASFEPSHMAVSGSYLNSREHHRRHHLGDDRRAEGQRYCDQSGIGQLQRKRSRFGVRARPRLQRHRIASTRARSRASPAPRRNSAARSLSISMHLSQLARDADCSPQRLALAAWDVSWPSCNWPKFRLVSG